MPYDFDQIIDRSNTFSLSTDGYMGYLFSDDTVIDNQYDDFIRMWVADMEFAVAPEILQAIKRRVDHGILGYTMIIDDAYATSFNQWCQMRYNHQFHPDHIVTADGVIPALYKFAKYLCADDEKIIIQTPSYSFFKHAADFNGRELVYNPLKFIDGQFEIDFEDFEKKTADPDVKLFFLCNPHNPTGRVWSDNDLRKLAGICFSNNVMIVSDEIHCDLLRKGVRFTPLAKLFPDSDQIITCMAPSKTFNLAGMKMANIAIPNDAILQLWNTDKYQVVNPLSTAAAMAAYEQGAPWLNALTDYLDTNFNYLNEQLKEHLPKAIFQISQATYLAWIDLGVYFEQDVNLTKFFAEHGVLLEGGDMFLHNADGYIRLNLACPRAKLEEGINRIINAVNSRIND